MIRQAHSYLAGAVSATVLLTIAVVAFVLLVSVQALRDWPLGGLGEREVESTPTSRGEAASSTPQPSAGGPAPSTATRSASTAPASGSGAIQAGQGDVNSPVIVPQSSEASAPPSAETPSAVQTESGSTSLSGSSGSAPASSGSATNKGASQIEVPGGGSSVSGAVSDTVNDTVAKADQALDGALGGTGVTKTTEGIVGNAVGPESSVGNTVDEVAGAVGGLLAPNR